MEWICFEGSVYTLYCREGQWSGSALRAVSILQRGPVEWICFEGNVYTLYCREGQWSGSVLRVVSILYTAERASGVDLL